MVSTHSSPLELFCGRNNKKLISSGSLCGERVYYGLMGYNNVFFWYIDVGTNTSETTDSSEKSAPIYQPAGLHIREDHIYFDGSHPVVL